MDKILKGVYIADAYFRLSKEDGDKSESDSIVNQKVLIREFLKKHPEIQIYQEKVDDGFTGVNFERPAFQEMMEDIKSGKVNCVIVKDLSRFGRNYIEAGRYIEKIFPYLGVRFIAVNDHIDTASEMNASEEMLIPFKNLINDAYCRDISVKIRSHLDIKRKNGQFIGAFAPYGYKKSPENKNQLIVDEKAAAVVRQIFKWKIEGMSGGRIADKLNELGILTPMDYKNKNGINHQSGFRTKSVLMWQTKNVNDILKNEMYTGVLVQGKTYSPNYKIRTRTRVDEKDWIRCENCHEAIISKETFQTVQELFKSDTRISPDKEALYLFSGFVKCGYCHGNMTRKTVPVNGKKYVYLICVEHKNKTGCTNGKNISLEKFEKIILQVINLHIEKVFELKKILEIAEKTPYQGYLAEKLLETIMEKELEIEKRQKYLSELYQDYKDGILSRDEYLELKESYQQDVVRLKKEIQALEEEKEDIAQGRKNQVEWMGEFIQYQGFHELTRELLLSLVKEIFIYDKDRIEVVFKFQEEYKKALDYVERNCLADKEN